MCDTFSLSFFVKNKTSCGTKKNSTFFFRKEDILFRLCTKKNGYKKNYCLPNQQGTLNKLPTELQRRNFVNKHRLSIQIDAERAKTCMQCVYEYIPTKLPFCIPLLVVGFLFQYSEGELWPELLFCSSLGLARYSAHQPLKACAGEAFEKGAFWKSFYLGKNGKDKFMFSPRHPLVDFPIQDPFLDGINSPEKTWESPCCE